MRGNWSLDGARPCVGTWPPPTVHHTRQSLAGFLASKLGKAEAEVDSTIAALLSGNRDELVLNTKRIEIVQKSIQHGALGSVWNLDHHLAASVDVFRKVFSDVQVDRLAIIYL